MSTTKDYVFYRIAAIASVLIALALLVYGIIVQDWLVAAFAVLIVACSLSAYPLIRSPRQTTSLNQSPQDASSHEL